MKAVVRVDVAVVGGGVSGALVTDAILEIGKTVAVFDRRGFTKGSTPASTALLQFEIDEPLIHLIDKIGRDRAVRAYWASATAIDYLAARVSDLELSCGFRERCAVLLPGNILNASELRAEAAARSRVGLRSHFVDRAQLRKLTTLDAAGAIWSAGAADVDPVALTDGLWRSAQKRGAELYAPAEITAVEPHRDFVTLSTKDGFDVRARHVVFATGYELLKLLEGTKHKISSTWVIATKPQPRKLWPTQCLIWEAADPYMYIRATSDGRVVAGGEDEEFSDEDHRDGLLPAKTLALQRKLHKLLPHLDTTPDAAWTGSFGVSPDGLPAIGPIPRLNRCFAVMGFGGNGITFSAIAATIIQRSLLGIPDASGDLFPFFR
ncbi:MAG: NAD(P)/FAD-dependent oxidoreductase [Micropepsaceae bacterium]